MHKVLMLLALMISSAANAAWITLEPDEAPVGTDVSEYWDGVTLSSVVYLGDYLGDASFTKTPVVIGESDRAVTGSHYFSPTYINSVPPWQLISNPRCFLEYRLCGYPTSALLLTFNELVAAVSILSNFKDAPSIWLFDADLNQVGACSSTFRFAENPCYEFLAVNPVYESEWRITATSDARNIRYAIIGGMGSPGLIDAISYSVPEPGTLALFGIGLLGFAMRRRLLGNAR